MWFYMCVVLFIAYKMHWGKKNSKDHKEDGPESVKGGSRE
jgi:hypothetical protein